jgi:putative MATE family efflux protein
MDGDPQAPRRAESAAVSVAAPLPPAAMSERTRELLEAPIARTLVRLAWPNLLVMLMQSAVGLIETYFVGWLGTDAIAGVAIVFPALMLMQMMSAGAIGGGISAAIARALGGGRRDDADALVMQALLIAVVLGGGFTAGALVFGPALYRALGGVGGSLAAALAYSDTLFAGMLLLWLLNTLASVLRGTGNMAVPSAVISGGAVLLVPLSPLLIFGGGPLPGLGIAGAAVAVLVYYAAGSLVLALYITSGRSVVRFRLWHLRPRPALLSDILKVGGIAALNTVQTNFTVAVITSLIGTAGPTAIAGYGIGSRLEYLLIPLVFGLGAPLVALVGTNIGGGRIGRAQRAAWIGAAVAFVMTEAIGLAAATWPEAWIGLFSADPAVHATGALYLHWVGPTFGAFGFGMALYFASQGAGRMLFPFLGGLVRLVIAAFGGWLLFRGFGAGPTGLFVMIALGLVAFGAVNASAVAAGAWRHGR